MLGVGQFVFACAMTLFYPTVQSMWYVYTPTLFNSMLSGKGRKHGLTMKLGLPCLFTSRLVVGLTSVTNQAVQSGTISESSSYNPEALSEAGPWNVIFWFIVFIIHGIVFTATSSPGDFFGLALCTCCGVYCLQVICSPSHEQTGHGPVGQHPRQRAESMVLCWPVQRPRPRAAATATCWPGPRHRR